MENSKISWTDHTFNPWIGCTKASAGCQYCYAEELMDKRFGEVQWGPAGTRKRTSQTNWRKPLQWNKQAWAECPSCGWRGNLKTAACPVCDRLYPNPARQRVFCASLADVFEDRPELEEWRRDMLVMIANTPNLDWLLLTKRSENVMPVINKALHLLGGQSIFKLPHRTEVIKLPDNVWIGTSVENQETADERIPHLLEIPAAVRFLSIEPLLGPINLRLPQAEFYTGQRIHWVIVGGESGPHARPMHPDWVRSIRDQCQESGIPLHFKQWGEWYPDKKGIYEGKDAAIFGNTVVHKLGKKEAGRLLDGREWNEYPEIQR